jgi:hypothetical protein
MKRSRPWPGLAERLNQRIRERYASVEDFTKAFPASRYKLGLVYRWITGQVPPSNENLFRLARDLELPMRYLLFGTATHVFGIPVDHASTAMDGWTTNEVEKALETID